MSCNWNKCYNSLWGNFCIFFSSMIRFYKYPTVYRYVLISPSTSTGWWVVHHSQMTSSQQQLMTALEFLAPFTLHWLCAYRIIISQLCFMSRNTGHASVLLREISKETMISKCLWGAGPLSRGITNISFLVSLFWSAISEFWAGCSIVIGDDKQLYIFLDIKGILAHIYVEGISTFEDGLICLYTGKGKDHGGCVLKISVSCWALFCSELCLWAPSWELK